MSVVVLLVLLAATTWLAYYWNKWRSRQFWQHINKIPGPPTLPLIGNAHQIGRNATELHINMMRYWKELGKKTFKIMLGPTPMVLLSSPECIEMILSSTTLIDKHDGYKMAIPYIGSSIINSTGKRWKTNRRMITPCFHFSILDGYFPAFNRTANGLAQKLSQIKQGQEIDVYPYVSKSILTGFCETSMGMKDISEKDVESYLEAADTIGSILMRRIFSTVSQFDSLFNLTKDGRLHKHCVEKAHNFQARVLELRREALKDEIQAVFASDVETAPETDGIVTRKRLAFLDLLLLTKTAEGKPVPDETILSETKTFIFAGHDTSTIAISCTLYMLSQHPEIQASVHEEQMSVFGGHERDVTHDDLQAMPYLDRVIKETMRVFPVVPMVGRKLNKQVSLPDGHILPAGTQLFMLLMCLHMDERSFPDPTKFDPERFLPENAKKLHPYAFVPFSAGPRNCIGQRYSLLTIRTVLSKLVRTFEFLPHAPGKEPILEAALVLHSANGINLRIRKRNIQQ